MDIAQARRLGDEILAACTAEMRAKAVKVVKIAELAEAYILPPGAEANHCRMVDALAEEVYPFGGPDAPYVSEYVALEVAAMLAVSKRKAAVMVQGAVHLKWQLPWLMNQVWDLKIDADRAVQASYVVADLPRELKQAAVQRWVRVQHRYSWGGAFKKLDEIVAQLDPWRADDESAELDGRRVQISVATSAVGRGAAAMGYIEAAVDVLDAKLFGAAVAQIAELLKQVRADESPLEVRRAKALGVLSRPAYALALIQQGAKGLPREGDAVEPLGDDGDPFHQPTPQRYLPAGCAGHVCGAIDVPLEKLQPRVSVEVVVEADAVGADPVARIDDATLIATSTLGEVLSGKTVQLRPVIDLPRLPDEDQYRPTLAMRRAVLARWRSEAFPFSTTRSIRSQLDHVISYFRNGPPGQTGLKKLIPLTSRVHRPKTALVWLVRMDEHARPIWTSPLGYQYLVTPYGTEPLLPTSLYRRAERTRRAQALAAVG